MSWACQPMQSIARKWILLNCCQTPAWVHSNHPDGGLLDCGITAVLATGLKPAKRAQAGSSTSGQNANKGPGVSPRPCDANRSSALGLSTAGQQGFRACHRPFCFRVGRFIAARPHGRFRLARPLGRGSYYGKGCHLQSGYRPT